MITSRKIGQPFTSRRFRSRDCCVVNRTLIPKLTNVKVSNKPPSKYLSEIKASNPNINTALRSHMLTDDLLGGDYDKNYDFFLEERAEAVLEAMRINIIEPRAEIIKQFENS
jgi:hypothetical protein